MVNANAIAEGDCGFIAMRTQNPVIYAATQKIAEELYPNDKPIPEDIRQIVHFIAKEHLNMPQFNEQTFVDRSTYGTSLYDQVQRHPRADDFFDNVLKLDYNAGDSVLLVGRLK
jgi:hypothetical protein